MKMIQAQVERERPLARFTGQYGSNAQCEAATVERTRSERPGLFQRWETSERYYIAVVQQNLFGDWEVMRIWGGKGSARGSMLCHPAANQAEALDHLSAVAQVRERHGYRRVLLSMSLSA
jgi:hypothetical protein